MRIKLLILVVLVHGAFLCGKLHAQRIQFPDPASGLRPINGSQLPSTSFNNPSGFGNTATMVPVNPATQAGIYPSTGYGSPTFDPYGNSAATGGLLNPAPGGFFSGPSPSVVMPPSSINPQALGGYPTYTGPAPGLPGTGQSAIVGTYPNPAATYSQPGLYPNNSPSALFPGTSYGNTNSGGLFGNFFSGIFGSSSGGNFGGSLGQPVYPPQGYGAPAYGTPGYGLPYSNGIYPPNFGGTLPAWNPQGSVFSGNSGYPEFVRLFQGPRIRHAWVNGNNDSDGLMINDTDLGLAFAIPNFLFSTQPLYLMPSFSLHQWDGPRPPDTADLPALAYSAFLDSGWQSDPARILGAELGLRVGMFSDFDTATSDSLRVMGRGIARVRLTPRLTLKGGAMYLDRNKVKLLPAGGILWQPNPETRFDLFFPEPKLSHYLSTVGTADTWWYVGGYYGGGSWTVKRTNNSKDSVDINDLRLVLGLEWGRNDQMRDGRRVGFFEVGYVFDRELLYKSAPADNLDLQDSFMIRAGLGY